MTINNVYVYNRDTLKVSEYSTVENSLGVIASNSECFVIPGQERGSLTVIVLSFLLYDNRVMKAVLFI